MRFFCKSHCLSILLATSFITLGAGANPLSISQLATPVGPNQIKVMQWNVENLFNTVHNDNKNDYEFLPLNSPLKSKCASSPFRDRCFATNWTPEHLKVKLSQIMRVVKAQGGMPDLLALEEVEGADLVEFLAKNMGYSGYLIKEGSDRRGIDVALLYHTRKLKLLNWDAINVTQALGKPTRDILRAHFSMAGVPTNSTLAMFVNHWPSQGDKPAARIAVANVLRREIEKGFQSLGTDKYKVIAVGDFNVLDNESPNAIRQSLLSGPNGLLDVRELSSRSQNPVARNMPPGTYYYEQENSWSYFDHILISKNLAASSGIRVEPTTYRILAAKEISNLRKNGVFGPWTYDYNSNNPEQAGFSDHYPLSVVFGL